MIFNQRDFLEY